MKLLITGGGGFLGARLARTLLRRGHLAGQPIDAMVLTDIACMRSHGMDQFIRLRHCSSRNIQWARHSGRIDFALPLCRVCLPIGSMVGWNALATVT